MTKVYFPPIHLTHFFFHKNGCREVLPVTERVANEIISLPIYPGMSIDDVNTVVDAISHFYSRIQ